jgi:hypothetical protein
MSDAKEQRTPVADAPGSPASAPGSSSTTKQPSLFDLIDNPWVVLTLLFFVMAILGLPVLWKSRGFSVLAKIGLSIVVALYTALLFYLLYLLFVWCWSQIGPALGYS